ncbi:uncharacterized protein LOC130105540 [Rhinichthys klamathensis goyatoka]|uniref:uncharacterized protein LOC130105540 n=1 Tax=Rhinichthys klamathensis goyatoka TaxID=3034132 RepID=UPI0024B58400|nr:uncharacterized protein LOC130105540 [Rhinichthys klamathensis goyatoka]
MASPLTSRKRLDDDLESVVTAGETVDSAERRQPGQGGLAPQTAAPEREHPKHATKNPKEKYPQGRPRGGENERPERTVFLATTNANGQSTTSAVCKCGKVCKNTTGLKIHQTKMGCLRKLVTQRTVPVLSIAPGETEEEPGPDTYHSAQSLQAPQATPQSRPSERRRFLWPAANKESVWRQFDEDVDAALEATAKGGVDQRLRTMSTFIISIASERFGAKEQRATKTSTAAPIPNRREVKITQHRQELRTLRRQYRKASEEEKVALAELRGVVRKRLITLRRAEWHRKRGKERARRRSAFIADPFGFTRKLLGEKRSGQLSCPEEDINRYIRNTYSDGMREYDLGHCAALICPPEPSTLFNINEPTLKEVKEVIKSARTSSAPGPSGVPYKVFKHCPRLLERLWKILRTIWRRGKVPQQWRYAEGVWIPKEENASNIEQFRTISLLSVECKIYFKIVSNRLMGFLLKNTYIDTSVQKGGIPGVPGCIEHTGVVTQLIREAREGKGDLAVLWLDLANAYGSIPHRLVELALSRYHVPEKIRNLILDYYNNFSLRVSSGTSISEWHRLEKGIITGCTISVTLFALAMNMLVKSAEVECRGPLSRSGTRQPPIRAFMDDLTVTTTTVPGCRWLLRGLEQLITWARMSFKPAKSRSLVLRKGKVADQFRFMLGDTIIPSVSEKPVKSLGKLFTHNLKDTAARKGTSDDFDTWLSAVDKSGLPGRFKAWIYQHGILPRLLWPLLIYEVPITTVEGFERKVSRFLRRWLGLPRSLSSVAFFGHNTKLQLPFSSLAEEFKVTRAREVLLYRDSVDTKVSSAGVEVRTGRKWRAQDAVERAEARLRHSTLVGTVATGRAGLGSNPKPCYSKARGKEKRKLIQEEVRAEVEEARFSRVVGMSKQGAWTKWEQTAGRKITWAELWKAEPHHFKFLVQSVYDVLPSPANLFTWGLVDSPACQLCQKRGSLEHILSCCSKALGDGRYRWRHDQILKAVADAISTGINISKQHHPTKSAIAFVRAGEKPQPPRKTQGGVLATARDWHLLVDLGTQLRFPDTIAVTSLRPDMVLMSAASKQVVLLELTVPWEDRMEEAQERKRAKYADLVAECRRNGWKARCEPVEVGCRGFAGQSLHRVLGLLGICGLHRQRAIKNILEAAEKAARWLWLRRGDAWRRALPGHKSGLDHPRLGRPGEGV